MASERAMAMVEHLIGGGEVVMTGPGGVVTVAARKDYVVGDGQTWRLAITVPGRPTVLDAQLYRAGLETRVDGLLGRCGSAEMIPAAAV